MASENRRGTLQKLRQGTLDAFVRAFPFLAIAGIVLAAAVMVAIGSPELAKNGLETIGIPVILGSVVLIVNRRVGSFPTSKTVTSGGFSDSFLGRTLRRKRVTVSAFLLLFAVSVLLLATSPYRPWSYFVVVSLIYALILFQILVGEFDPKILLTEIPLLMLNLIYGVTLKYQYYYGWSDVFMHLERAKITQLTGETISQSVSLLYANFPLYHIFVSEATYVLNTDMKTALFVITAFPYVVTSILLYYLVEGNFHDERIPALVTVIYSANTIVLFYGSYMITRTMAFVGFMFILYLIHKRSIGRSGSVSVLLVLMMVFTTLVHQVSMPMIMVLLMGLYVCELAVGYTRFIDIETLLLIGFGFLSYWLFNAWEFLSTIIVVYLQPDLYAGAGGGSPGGGGQGGTVEFAYWLRYTLHNHVIVFYSIVGVGMGLYKERSRYVHTLLLFGLLTLGIFVPSPLRVIEQVMSVLRFDRFMLLVSPFVAIAMGTGVVWFVRQVNYNTARNSLGTGLALVLLVTYVFTSVSAPLIASDSKDLPWADSRNHLTEQEVEGFDFVLRNVEPGSTIRSTSRTTKFFDRQAFNDHGRQYQPPYASESIANISNVGEYEGYTVFRTEKFQESGLDLSFTGGTISPTPETEDVLNREFREKSKVFSNGGVDIYYTNATDA